MEGSAWQTFKESARFVWEHMRVILAAFVFAIITLLVLMILMGIAAGIGGVAQCVDAVKAGSVEQCFKLLLSIVALSPFFYLFGLYYPGVGLAWYNLGLLRREPVTIGQAVSRGFSKFIQGWRVALGELLLRAVPFLLIAGVVGSIQARDTGAVVGGIGFIVILWIIGVITVFTCPLVADGVVSFRKAIGSSWRYVKRSWVRLLALVLYLFLVTLILSPITWFLGSIGSTIVNSIIGPIYAVALLKVYLQARALDVHH